MFKDCKTGGYNLEGSQASPDKLVRLVLLIALAMTSAWLQGEKTSILGKYPYICRSKEAERNRRRHSNFWVGLYGHNWIVAFHECQEWVQEFIDSVARGILSKGVEGDNAYTARIIRRLSPPEELNTCHCRSKY